jgi:hypothetical protein
MKNVRTEFKDIVRVVQSYRNYCRDDYQRT